MELEYVEERIEDFFPSSSSDEANDAIKELLEKNRSLQEVVRKLKREQEIQSIRLCEIMGEKNKTKVKMEAKINEIQHQSIQEVDLIDQLSNANEEMMNLRSEK